MKVTKADFVSAASSAANWPRIGLPEIAFAGRSNVGKSSLINTLLGRKKLARTSANPGHTRLLNFYNVNERYSFADLPGYGYAKTAKAERDKWKKMVEEYLAQRDELKAVVILMDLRREPGPEEVELIGFLTGHGVTPVLVATKADKLGKTKRVKPLANMALRLGIPKESIISFSSHTGEGKDKLWAKIKELLD